MALATTSTIPTVKTRIVELLTDLLGTAALDGGPVTVEYDHSGADRAEHVWLGDVRGRRVVPNVKSGRLQRQETYSVDLYIRVEVGEASTPETVELRGYSHLAAVENLFANTGGSTLKGLYDNLVVTLGDFETTTDTLEQGAEILIRQEINVSARLV